MESVSNSSMKGTQVDNYVHNPSFHSTLMNDLFL